MFCWNVKTCSLVNRHLNSTKNAEALDYFETMVPSYQPTRRQIPEDGNMDGLEASRYQHNTDRRINHTYKRI